MKKQQTKWTEKHMERRKQPRVESEEATVLNLDITGSCLKGLSYFCLLTNASASRNRERGSRQFETWHLLENAKGNQNTARLKFSFIRKKKDIYIYIYIYIFTSLMLNASRSPVVQFDQDLHCKSSSVNLTCSLLNHENTNYKNWINYINKNLVRELLKNL